MEQTGAGQLDAGSSTPFAVFVGDVMVDVIVRPTTTFNRGSDTPSAIAVRPGGSAANQSAAFAAAGGEAHLVAAVGDDVLGRDARLALERAGVRPHLWVVGGATTGVVVALVGRDGERSMLTDRGANAHLAAEAVDETLLRQGAHLHLSGYLLLDEATRATGVDALGRADAAAMTRSIEPSSAGPLADLGAEQFFSLAAGIDLLFTNLDEARVLTGTDHPAEAMASLREHFPAVVLTLGEGGALFSSPAGSAQATAPECAVVDTTGAGDAFTGTFLAGWLAGRRPADCLQSALIAAAAVIASPGARHQPSADR